MFGQYSAVELTKKFSSPLYIYDEQVLRENCNEIKKLCSLEKFHIHYAVKANSNIALLKIIRSEGLQAEVISIPELKLAQMAGWKKEEILFSGNNIAEEDLHFLIQNQFFVCLDSLCQLETYFALGGDNACIRINPLKGEGHHERVITAGKVKFGIDLPQVAAAFELATQKKKKITGINSHIGSLFLESSPFQKAVELLLQIAEKYPSINYIDFGGGFGIAYKESEEDFSISNYAKKFTAILTEWLAKTKREVSFGIQPGRYIVAHAGLCLAKVQSIKNNQGINFLGTDLGFNFLLRPEFYGAYHKIFHCSNPSKNTKKFTVTGNICESGDILGKDRNLPEDTKVGDLLAILDTGAYGFSMASNYNSMFRPAEVLLDLKGEAKLIRKRESFADLTNNQIF